MNNKDLLRLKIDVKTKKDIAFQEMAILVDNPYFLEKLPDLRKRYRVKELLSIREYFGGTDYFQPDEEFEVKIPYKKYERINNFKRLFPEQYEALKEQYNPFAAGSLIAETNLLCFEFRRPYYFAEIISQAIFCGVVNDEFYEATQTKVIDISEIGPFQFHLPQAAIMVTPTSTYEDTKESLRQAKRLIQKDKRLSYYQPRLDTVSNIRKYRHWYWEKLKNKTYATIADEWVDKHPDEANIGENEVLKGVKTYKQLLRQ